MHSQQFDVDLDLVTHTLGQATLASDLVIIRTRDAEGSVFPRQEDLAKGRIDPRMTCARRALLGGIISEI